jgi:hypothetical protein
MMILIINLEEEYDRSIIEDSKEVKLGKPLDNVPDEG